MGNSFKQFIHLWWRDQAKEMMQIMLILCKGKRSRFGKDLLKSTAKRKTENIVTYHTTQTMQTNYSCLPQGYLWHIQQLSRQQYTELNHVLNFNTKPYATVFWLVTWNRFMASFVLTLIWLCFCYYVSMGKMQKQSTDRQLRTPVRQLAEWSD